MKRKLYNVLKAMMVIIVVVAIFAIFIAIWQEYFLPAMLAVGIGLYVLFQIFIGEN